MNLIAAAALVARGHRGHIFLIILGVIVAGALVYFGVRAAGRRRAGPSVDAPWNRPAPADPGAASGTAAAAHAFGASPPVAPAPATAPPTAPEAPATAPPTAPPATPPPAAPAPRRPPRQAGAGGQWAVETHGLTKRFGPIAAVDDVELLVPRGCAFGYLGPNGAGKTTLIRTLLGLTHADAGSISLLGVPVPSRRSEALAHVGAIVDEPRFYSHLTGRQNLLMLSAARGGDAAKRIPPSLERVGLTERADHKVSSYSMGMRQRLGVASCLLADPALLILDEPMNGLDPAGMQEMRAMIQGLVGEGRTVMLSSHLLDEVERTCDEIAIVDRGRVIQQGPIDELVRGAAGFAVRVECSDPVRAAQVLDGTGLASATMPDGGSVTVTFPPGATREVVAEVVRRLVAGDVSVYSLQEIRASLEDWFLSVTSRFGGQS